MGSSFLLSWHQVCADLHEFPTLLRTVRVTPCPHLPAFVHDVGMASNWFIRVPDIIFWVTRRWDVLSLYCLDISSPSSYFKPFHSFGHETLWKEEPILIDPPHSPSISHHLMSLWLLPYHLPETALPEVSLDLMPVCWLGWGLWILMGNTGL